MSAAAATPAPTNRLAVDGILDPDRAQTLLTLPTGEVILLPTTVLTAALTSSQLAEPLVAHASSMEQVVIPVIEERLSVTKRTVETKRVRLRKIVEEHTERVSVPLEESTWSVQHVPVERVITELPATRTEGDTTIYPIVEERVVVTRQLVLKEELRITRAVRTRKEDHEVVLRRESVVEEHEDLRSQATPPLA